MTAYHDRSDAGRKLAHYLTAYTAQADTLVLALPRGGVGVACEVASALRLPLDILLVRKLGVPGHEELAMGALAQGGVQVLNQGIITQLHIMDTAIARVVAQEQAMLERRNQLYCQGRANPEIRDKTILLIDAGAARFVCCIFIVTRAYVQWGKQYAQAQTPTTPLLAK